MGLGKYIKKAFLYQWNLLVFLGGMGFLVLIALWITAKRREPWDVAQERNSARSGTEHE